MRYGMFRTNIPGYLKGKLSTFETKLTENEILGQELTEYEILRSSLLEPIISC